MQCRSLLCGLLACWTYCTLAIIEIAAHGDELIHVCAAGCTFTNFEADQGAAWLAVPSSRSAAPYGAATIDSCIFLRNTADTSGPALHIDQRQTVSLFDSAAPSETNIILAADGGAVAADAALSPKAFDSASDYDGFSGTDGDADGEAPLAEASPAAGTALLQLQEPANWGIGNPGAVEVATTRGGRHLQGRASEAFSLELVDMRLRTETLAAPAASSATSTAPRARKILQSEASPQRGPAAIAMVVEASATPGVFLERSRVYSSPNMNVQLVGVPGAWQKVAMGFNESDADTARWLRTPEVVKPPSRNDPSFQKVLEV